MKYLPHVLVICGCVVLCCGDAATPTNGKEGVPDDGEEGDDATCNTNIIHLVTYISTQ